MVEKQLRRFFEDPVKAVEDGKGKDDLTAALVEPIKANQVSSSRQEISTGVSCSNLFAEDIIKLLTGDSEL